ncbi:MAG: hypothetical protein KIT83_02590 [Bryobacterales bacterium]|nr:hypothetical protein [Bryobacterales bacterium]
MLSDGGYLLIIRDVRASLLAGLLALWFVTGCGFAAPVDDARIAFGKANFQEAIRLLMAQPKPDAEALLLLGKAQFLVGDFDSAASSLRSSLDAGNDTSECRDWLGRALGMQAERANPFSALGLARKARDEFQKAVALDPKNLEAVSDLFSFYLAAPGFLGGGLDKARELTETVKNQDAAEYAGMRSQIAEKEKDYAAAEQWLKRAIDAAPRSIGRRIDLARFYSRRGVLLKADAAFAEAKALQPSAARLLFDEASLLVRSGRDPAKARRLIEEYRRASRTSDDPSPYDTAQLLAKLEKLEKDQRTR